MTDSTVHHAQAVNRAIRDKQRTEPLTIREIEQLATALLAQETELRRIMGWLHQAKGYWFYAPGKDEGLVDSLTQAADQLNLARYDLLMELKRFAGHPDHERVRASLLNSPDEVILPGQPG